LRRKIEKKQGLLVVGTRLYIESAVNDENPFMVLILQSFHNQVVRNLIRSQKKKSIFLISFTFKRQVNNCIQAKVGWKFK